MAEIFISYAHEDHEQIAQLAGALASAGFDVWWDRNLAGGAEFSKELEARLNAAQAVVVVWSRSSVESNWVADEASEGRDRGCLVPVVIDDARPRIGFRQYQTLQFDGWKGNRDAVEFQQLVSVLNSHLQSDGPATRPAAVEGPSPRRFWNLKLAGVTTVAAAMIAALFAIGFAGDEEKERQALAEQAAQAGVESTVADQSIAILPFTDMSAEQDQAYFSEGVAEEILNVLTRVNRLKVASRTSSFRFKNRDDIGSKTIARDLGVRHLLEGSVRKAGETIRVTVGLVDSSRDETIWSRTFDQVLTVENVLSIQDEIAVSVVEALGGKIGIGNADTQRFAAAAATDNLAAYEVFLEGRELFSRRRTENLPAIISLFEKAVRLDSDFSRAWEALAATYSVAPGWGVVDRPYHSLAIEAANRALALRPDLALATAVLGTSATFEGAPDYVRSIDQYSRAIELDRYDPTLWSWRGQELSELGFFDAAEQDLRQALELDPASTVSQLWLARTLFYAGKLEAATRAFMVLDDQMGSVVNVRALALTLAVEGREDLLEELRSQAIGPGLEARFISDLFEDTDFDFEQGYTEYMAMLEEAYGYVPGLPARADFLHSYKRFADIPTPLRTSGHTVWWYKYDEKFLTSPHRYRIIRDTGIERYWREREFPPQCRPLSEDQIQCL